VKKKKIMPAMTVRECERYYRSRGQSRQGIISAVFWGIICGVVLVPKKEK